MVSYFGLGGGEMTTLSQRLDAMMYDSPRFLRCNAPICPLDPDKAKATWFVEEPISVRESMAGELFIRNEKKIVCHIRKCDTDTIFTHRGNRYCEAQATYREGKLAA